MSFPFEIIQQYWTFEKDGEIFDGELDTKEQAQEWAEDAFAEQCMEECPGNNERFEEEIYLICFAERDGEFVVIHREESTVEYIHYHGDHAEHFWQGRFV